MVGAHVDKSNILAEGRGLVKRAMVIILIWVMVRLLLGRHDGETHRAHETHLIDLLAGMNLHLVPSGFPAAWRGRQFQIAALILQGDVHRVFGEAGGWIEPLNSFWPAPSEDCKCLVMLMQ